MLLVESVDDYFFLDLSSYFWYVYGLHQLNVRIGSHYSPAVPIPTLKLQMKTTKMIQFNGGWLKVSVTNFQEWETISSEGRMMDLLHTALQRHWGAWTTWDNWNVDPDYKSKQDSDPFRYSPSNTFGTAWGQIE